MHACKVFKASTTSTSSADTPSTEPSEELLQVLKVFLEIRDRKWRTKTYTQCFLHSQAVEFVMKHKNVDEETAVANLNALRNAGYIQHVVDPHKPFKVGQSKKLYFCFLDDENAHVIQTQKAALEKAKIAPPVLQSLLKETSEFKALQVKMKRMEDSLTKMKQVDRSTQTKLEIVHQATISLIRAMVATAFLLLILILFTLYIVVPILDHRRSVQLTTSLLALLLMAGFVAQGMNLFSIWLQLDTSVVQAAEGEDAVEDYDETQLSVTTTTSSVASATGSAAIPRPQTLQKRQTSLFLKEPILRPGLSRNISAATASNDTIQQRSPHDLPPPSQWPHRPVLVCVNTPVCKSLTVPDYGTGPCPLGKPFAFSSDLFEGQCMIRIRNATNSNAPEDDQAYFAGRRRLFQTIVQGRFKQPLPVDQVLTGHEFVKPLQNLPHPWILKAATNLIGKLAPGCEIQVLGNQPTMLASLAATSQIVRGDEPGNEPDLATIVTEDLEEDCSLLGGKFATSKVSSMSRKLHLANPERAAQYTFDTETVYTFDFYQSLLNVQTYSLDLGVANIGMGPILNGQPIQCLCKTVDGRYLWSFQVWHESLLPEEVKVEKGSGEGKRKSQ